MSDVCSHRKPSLPGEVEVQRLIDDAAIRCAADGQRWTGPRRRVFELLVRAAAPVKAYDLIAAFDENEPGSTKPPTVYRALEFLEAAGLAHRIPSLNAFMACAGAKEVHAASFFICDCCGGAEEIEPQVADLAAAKARARGFQPRTVSVEIRGACHACATAKGAKPPAASRVRN